MNDTDIFDQAQQVRGYNVQSIIAMCLFSEAHKTKAERKAIKAAWECDPLPYARAVQMMPHWFDSSVEPSYYELQSLVAIAKVKNKYARALLAEEWQRLTLSFNDVRERVESLKKPRERKPRVCPKCGAEL